jgi:hypothetical protein
MQQPVVKQALQDCKHVASIQWFFECKVYGRLMPISDDLLPQPDVCIPGFREMFPQVCISGFQVRGCR